MEGARSAVPNKSEVPTVRVAWSSPADTTRAEWTERTRSESSQAVFSYGIPPLFCL